MDRRAPGRGEPRWMRYGMHWHLFVREHDLADRARASGSVADRYRSDPPDRVGCDPAEVLRWQQDRIRDALRGATGQWADGRRQGLGDLDGAWADRLRGRLDDGLSSFHTVRVSDTRVVDVAAYAVTSRECGQHRG